MNLYPLLSASLIAFRQQLSHETFSLQTKSSRSLVESLIWIQIKGS